MRRTGMQRHEPPSTPRPDVVLQRGCDGRVSKTDGFETTRPLVHRPLPSALRLAPIVSKEVSKQIVSLGGICRGYWYKPRVNRGWLL